MARQTGVQAECFTCRDNDVQIGQKMGEGVLEIESEVENEICR